MRAILTTLMLTIASETVAKCSNLFDEPWWITATTANLRVELDQVAGVIERNAWGEIQLHYAA
jgi:hypothetical protein